MKLDKIILHHVRMPLKARFETSFGPIDNRDCIIVEVHAGDIVAFGECAADRDPLYSYENVSTAWAILKDYLAPLVLKDMPVDARAFQSSVAFVRGHNMAKAGLEMALWDLWGRQSGKSLREMFAGERSSVAVGVSIGIQPNLDDLIKVANGYVEQGYQRIKIKIKPGRDVAETQAMRQNFPDMKLQVDANSAYTLENFKSLLPLDDLNLLLIEQPLGEDDIWDHSKMQREFKTPICLDESIVSPRHASQAIEMDASRVINIKPGRVGGLSQALEIHDLCQVANIPVWCGGMLETNVGRASNLAVASLPGFTLPGDISASARYYHEDITEEEFILNDNSTIDVPDSAGLGVTINRASLEKFTLKSTEITPE